MKTKKRPSVKGLPIDLLPFLTNNRLWLRLPKGRFHYFPKENIVLCSMKEIDLFCELKIEKLVCKGIEVPYSCLVTVKDRPLKVGLVFFGKKMLVSSPGTLFVFCKIKKELVGKTITYSGLTYCFSREGYSVLLRKGEVLPKNVEHLENTLEEFLEILDE